jgi:predicted nucleic acid-binding protein
MNGLAFVDASAWVGLADPDDKFAAAARSIVDRLARQGATLLTSNWTVYEALTVMRKGSSDWQGKVETLRRMVWELRAAIVEVVTPELESQAIRRFFDLGRYPRRAWGIVDFANFVIMDTHGIKQAFTQDASLRDLGYVILQPLNSPA